MVSDRAIKPKLDQVSSLSRGFRLLLLGLVLARGLVYLCVMPPFEGWDECQHVALSGAALVVVLRAGDPAFCGIRRGERLAAFRRGPAPGQPPSYRSRGLGRPRSSRSEGAIA